MEIVKNFGLDPFLFGAQVINFLIILYLLKRFLYKPILEVLKKREEAIKEGLKQAEDARILLEKTQEREKQILKKAQESARQTVGEAKNEALVLAKKIEEDARRQAEKLIDDARKQIALEGKEAERNLTSKIGELSIEFLQASIREIFTEKEQKEVLEKARKQLGRN